MSYDRDVLLLLVHTETCFCHSLGAASQTFKREIMSVHPNDHRYVHMNVRRSIRPFVSHAHFDAFKVWQYR